MRRFTPLVLAIALAACSTPPEDDAAASLICTGSECGPMLARLGLPPQEEAPPAAAAKPQGSVQEISQALTLNSGVVVDMYVNYSTDWDPVIGGVIRTQELGSDEIIMERFAWPADSWYCPRMWITVCSSPTCAPGTGEAWHMQSPYQQSFARRDKWPQNIVHDWCRYRFTASNGGPIPVQAGPTYIWVRPNCPAAGVPTVNEEWWPMKQITTVANTTAYTTMAPKPGYYGGKARWKQVFDNCSGSGEPWWTETTLKQQHNTRTNIGGVPGPWLPGPVFTSSW